ncbi:MAG: hypothetical protein ABIY51_05960, partial [Ferruginibacter sp.]
KPSDGYNFKVVIKQLSTKQAADIAFQRLASFGHKLVLITDDSIHYKISIPFTTPIADTLRAKDSLSRFFKTKTYIVL